MMNAIQWINCEHHTYFKWLELKSQTVAWSELVGISRISSFIDAHPIWKLPKHQTNVKSHSNQSRFMTWNPESVYIVLFQTSSLFLLNPWLFVEKDGSWNTWGIGSCKQLTGGGRGCCYPSALVDLGSRFSVASMVVERGADWGRWWECIERATSGGFIDVKCCKCYYHATIHKCGITISRTDPPVGICVSTCNRI